jgi:hypothetical protein
LHKSRVFEAFTALSEPDRQRFLSEMRAYLATKRELFDAWRRGVLIAPAHRRDFFDQFAYEAKLRERRGYSTAHIWRLQAQRAHDEYLLRRIVDESDEFDDRERLGPTATS